MGQTRPQLELRRATPVHSDCPRRCRCRSRSRWYRDRCRCWSRCRTNLGGVMYVGAWRDRGVWASALLRNYLVTNMTSCHRARPPKERHLSAGRSCIKARRKFIKRLYKLIIALEHVNTPQEHRGHWLYPIPGNIIRLTSHLTPYTIIYIFRNNLTHFRNVLYIAYSILVENNHYMCFDRSKSFFISICNSILTWLRPHLSGRMSWRDRNIKLAGYI